MTPKTLDKYIAAVKKKAASEGWPKTKYDAELDKLHDEMVNQYNSGQISYSEMMGAQKKIVNAQKKMALQGGASASSVPMTSEEHKALSMQLKDQYMSGMLTFDEWDEKKTKLTEAYKGKKSLADAQAAIGISVPAAVPAHTPASPPVSAGQGAASAQVADAKLEKKLTKVYGQAAKEIEEELKKLEKECGPEMRRLEGALAAGTITPEEAAWLKMQTLKKAGLQQKLDQATGVMLHANEKALAMVNGEQLHVFAENANWQAYKLEQDVGMNLSFAIYDENTVEMLIRENPELLPRRVDVDGKKDKAWNKTKMADAVTQAVIQGDSIPKLAKRVATETGETNMKAMRRYARTAMTGAQNKGRIAMLHRAKDLGIQVKKVWLATLDGRTRDSHQHMDGVAVEVDEKFKTPLGSKMDCPGDLAGKAGDVWNCRCTLTYDYEGFPYDPAENERIQYDEYYTEETDADGKKHKVFHRTSSVIKDMTYDEWKAVKQAGKMNDLNLAKTDLSAAQKAVIKANVDESKVYSGLWKDDVTLADYPAKKGGIQAKLDWYGQEIAKYKDAQQNGASWATDAKIQDLEDKKKLLEEYRDHGELLEQRNAALKKVQDIYGTAGFIGTAKLPGHMTYQAPSGSTKNSSQFAPDAWDERTKKAARSFSQRSSADKALRPELDAEWDNLTDEEKYAVWEYTRNSNPMNKSLSGYHESWSRSNYIGPEKTDWGHEDNYRTIDTPGMKKFAKSNGHVDYHKADTNLTLAIEKTPLKKGTWLVRGSDENGLAGMMEGGGMSFNQVKSLFDGRHSLSEIKTALVGQKGRNHAFTSTGIAKDAGFGGNIKYEIYAPAGTKCIYAEPQSYYGQTSSTRIYQKGASYRSVGGEAEVIVQRGTVYRITDIRQSGRTYTMVMEIVEQPDYFVHGDEDTFNGGKTRHKR